MKKTGITKNIVFVMTAVAVILILWGMMSGDVGTMMNMIVIAILISFIPFFFYKYSRMLWVKSIEDQFPAFLRDLADLISSGMSFPEAIKVASKSKYGNLTDEVVEMNNKLSWGIPFLRVIEMFTKKLKQSRIIAEIMHIIKESFISGGNISATLDSIANNITTLKEVEEERTSMLKQQVFIMYGIFFMFLVITILIITMLVPIITTTDQGTISASGIMSLGFKDPCAGSSAFPCPLYSVVGVMLNSKPGITSYYTSMFFLTALIEAIFIGLIAGQIGSNSIISGLKHSLIMLFATVGIFFFLAKIGLFM